MPEGSNYTKQKAVYKEVGKAYGSDGNKFSGTSYNEKGQNCANFAGNGLKWSMPIPTQHMSDFKAGFKGASGGGSSRKSKSNTKGRA
ncbi:hypothetical protein GGI23_006644 [Coemansia sp. RSA 2559]|nr:hypothetical protein GGI23_006644 [Coemansia sp. RSA 2559]